MDEIYVYFIVLSAIAVLGLVVLAVSYWWIMRQDGSVLTAVAGGIGAIVGYAFKLAWEKLKGRDHGSD